MHRSSAVEGMPYYSLSNNNSSKPNQDQAFAMEFEFLNQDDFVPHCRLAIDSLCKAFQNWYREFEKFFPILGGTTLSGAAVLGSQILTFNIGDSLTVVAQRSETGAVTCLHQTKAHSPQFDCDSSDIFEVRPVYDADRLIMEDFKKEDGTPCYSRLKLKGSSNKLRLDTKHMDVADKRTLLTALGQRPHKDRALDSEYYDICIPKEREGHKYGLLAVSRALGDDYSAIGHDVEFESAELLPGQYILAAMTDGVTAICKAYPDHDERISLEALLTDVLAVSNMDALDHAKNLCILAQKEWKKAPAQKAERQDDISSSVLMHNVTDSRLKIIFVADGHGIYGHMISSFLTSLLAHFLEPYLQFLQKPCQDEYAKFQKLFDKSKFEAVPSGLGFDLDSMVTFLRSEVTAIMSKQMPSAVIPRSLYIVKRTLEGLPKLDGGRAWNTEASARIAPFRECASMLNGQVQAPTIISRR